MARRMNPAAEAALGWTLALWLATVFCALGVWQYGRAQEKRTKLAEAAQALERREAQPLSVAGDASRLNAYDWAEGQGEFADAPAILLDNQQREGRAGVRAYRLFAPVDAPPLLVELGWLPLPGNREMPDVARPPGTLRVRGLLAPSPSPGIVEAQVKQAGRSGLLTTRLGAVTPAMLGTVALPPRVLRLDPALDEIGYIRDLDILPNTMPPERHIAYAVQWFGLASTVLIVAVLLTLRRRRRAARAKMAA